MTRDSTTVTEETTTGEQTTTEPAADKEYNLPVELFAGIVIFIMGLLVLITPLIYEMPTDLVWDPILINVASGTIYLLVGAFFVYRSDYI